VGIIRCQAGNSHKSLESPLKPVPATCGGWLFRLRDRALRGLVVWNPQASGEITTRLATVPVKFRMGPSASRGTGRGMTRSRPAGDPTIRPMPNRAGRKSALRHQAVVLVLLAVLSACATTTVTEFQAPDGTTLKTVKCTSDPAKCYAQASQSCPDRGTYRVVASESHAGGIAADILPGPVTWYSMTFACGPSDGRLPNFAWQGPQYTPPPSAPAPVLIQQKPTTTNCTRIGSSVSCTSY